MHQYRGLTLIEVLIALAIIAIAMTAVIKAGSQSIRGTTYLQEKTMAMWAGQQALNEIRAGAKKFAANEDIKQAITMLGKDWYILLRQEETRNKHIKKISAKVFTQEIESESGPMVSLESYLYVQ